jgi:5-methylcytosine-specific restriction endonuclease McrA
VPIKPENKSRYPADWKAIRTGILERAQDRCEWCGVQNHAIGQRDAAGVFHELPGMQAEVAALDGERTVQIVLTIAHLDHTPEHNEPTNLAALCQKCHNTYDQPHRKKNAAETRRKRGGQMALEVSG